MTTLDVLAIAAHPDDAELCCGGTLAALGNQGLHTGVLDLSRGEMGTRGTPEERLEEARDASVILGITWRNNLGLADGGLTNTPEHRLAIIRQIRSMRPSICLINPLIDRHPDHGNAARLVLDALFYSGLAKIETTDESDNTQKPWRPYHIFHYMHEAVFTPSVIFDITDTYKIKEKAILAFKSQFKASDGPKTYISGDTFFESVQAKARFFGHQIGVTYGEPFLYHGGPMPMLDFGSLLKSKPLR